MWDDEREAGGGPEDGEPAEVLEHLQQLARFGVKLGLDRMRVLLRRLGHPERRFGVVHIAGTNGKGSTAAGVAAIARAAGVRTGLYTSPHLIRFCERMVVDQEPISPGALQEAHRVVDEAARQTQDAEGPLTHFEFVTAMAFWYFAQMGVELAVVEVGLGGRLDATNVVEKPEVCAITRLGLDHTKVLGPRIEDVAREKAGILKPGCDALTVAQPQDAAAAVVHRQAQAAGAPLWVVQEEEVRAEARPPTSTQGLAGRYVYRVQSVGPGGTSLDLVTPDGQELAGLHVPLLGRHQAENAALAVSVAHRLASRGWSIPLRAFSEGLSRVEWPARLQVLRRQPRVVLDGAHNPAAARALSMALVEVFGSPADVLVIGMLAEKDVDGVLDELVRPGCRVVATRSRSARTTPADPEDLARRALLRGASAAASVEPAEKALKAALEWARPNELVVVAGSLYLAGEILGGELRRNSVPREGIRRAAR